MKFEMMLALPTLALLGLTAQSPPATFGVRNSNAVAPSTSPIQLESCRLGSKSGADGTPRVGALEIQFTNEGAVPADLIRFRVSWGISSNAYLRDAGTFSQGVTIKHKFRQFDGESTVPYFVPDSVHCAVESAHFVDGTVWTNPSPGPDSPTATQIER